MAITFHLRLKGMFSVACACENFGRSVHSLAMDPTLALIIGVVTMCHCCDTVTGVYLLPLKRRCKFESHPAPARF